MKKSKNLIAMILSLSVIISLPACKDKNNNIGQSSETTTNITETTIPETTTVTITTTSTTTSTTSTTTTITTTNTTTITTTTTEESTEWVSPLTGYTAYDLINVSKNEFIEGVNWDYEEVGQWAEFANDGVQSSMFPGYTISYGSGSYPRAIGVSSGMITESTWVGMSYNELISNLGIPEGYGLYRFDGSAPYINYNINGIEVMFHFNNVSSDNYGMDNYNIAKQLLESTNTSVTYASLRNF